jgi:single-strand DNA-binding protein
VANYNKCIFVGNMTRDPQMKYLPSQMAVTEFGLAVNHKFKTKTGEDREEVLFIDCAAFGKNGEIINQYAQKGKQMLVEGRLKFDTWDDKQGGGKRSKHSLIVDNFQFLGGRDAADDSNQDVPAQRAKPAPYLPNRPPARPVSDPISDDPQFKDAEIPF